MIYTIDRGHPLVSAVLLAAHATLAKPIETMLKILEETVPIQQIWLDVAEHPEEVAAPFHGATAKTRRGVLVTCYKTIRRVRGLDHCQTVEILQDSEEFADAESQAIISTLTEDT